MRTFTLLFVVALAAGALYLRSSRPAPADAGASPPLTYVATAQQLGVVGYRDPVGVLSADGRFVAYSEGRYVRVIPLGGGSSPLLPPADGQVRWLEWLGEGRLLAEATGAAARWWIYDIDRAAREPLWGGEGAAATQPAGPARPGANLLDSRGQSRRRGSRPSWPHGRSGTVASVADGTRAERSPQERAELAGLDAVGRSPRGDYQRAAADRGAV
jgi:hypothetical protein